ncbi:hypothetical protein B0H19DRAFT_1081557 [Mycena capillaripes]|nr:hypothetical protein B0H19DRAFT_1081557 [Mycena capillaripes]
MALQAAGGKGERRSQSYLGNKVIYLREDSGVDMAFTEMGVGGLRNKERASETDEASPTVGKEVGRMEVSETSRLPVAATALPNDTPVCADVWWIVRRDLRVLPLGWRTGSSPLSPNALWWIIITTRQLFGVSETNARGIEEQEWTLSHTCSDDGRLASPRTPIVVDSRRVFVDPLPHHHYLTLPRHFGVRYPSPSPASETGDSTHFEVLAACGSNSSRALTDQCGVLCNCICVLLKRAAFNSNITFKNSIMLHARIKLHFEEYIMRENDDSIFRLWFNLAISPNFRLISMQNRNIQADVTPGQLGPTREMSGGLTITLLSLERDARTYELRSSSELPTRIWVQSIRRAAESPLSQVFNSTAQTLNIIF